MTAHAASWLEFEAGVGAAQAVDMDGVWNQHKVAGNREALTTPAYLLGATGELARRDSTQLLYHADYVYFGTQSASCECVSDAAYAAHDYSASTNQFVGSGHVQGIALTLSPAYAWRGTRFAIEGGPFVFWETWHEYAYLHPTQAVRAFGGGTLGYVIGARVERGPFGMSYRYYSASPQWRTYPGLTRGFHVLSVTYRF